MIIKIRYKPREARRRHGYVIPSVVIIRRKTLFETETLENDRTTQRARFGTHRKKNKKNIRISDAVNAAARMRHTVLHARWSAARFVEQSGRRGNRLFFLFSFVLFFFSLFLHGVTCPRRPTAAWMLAGTSSQPWTRPVSACRDGTDAWTRYR